MWWSRRLTAGALLLGLAACGFQPLYGKYADGNVPSRFAGIEVVPIPDRVGQLLRNHLLDALTPAGPPATPRYRLQVSIRTSQEAVVLQKDDSATRRNLTLRAEYVLADLSSGATMAQGVTHAVASYNVVRSDFATLTAEQDAARRAVRTVSTDIVTRLAVALAVPGRGA